MDAGRENICEYAEEGVDSTDAQQNKLIGRFAEWPVKALLLDFPFPKTVYPLPEAACHHQRVNLYPPKPSAKTYMR